MTTALDDLNTDPNLDPPPSDPPPSDPPPSDPPSDPPADPPPSDPPAADWRKDLAGDDEKMMKRLGRYSTQNDAIKAGLEAQDKLRTTRSTALPDNATDEQLAEYREQNGIPKTFGEYDMTLADGLVIGEDDKAMVDGYLEAMHGENASQAQITAGLNAFYNMREAEIADLEVQDNTDRGSALEALKEEWGPDYHGNKNALSAIVNQIPESVREEFTNARLADGTALMNSPEMLMFLADMSRKTNPAATVVGNNPDPSGAIKNELATLNEWMKTQDDRYWKDDSAQARWRELTDAKDAMG